MILTFTSSVNRSWILVFCRVWTDLSFLSGKRMLIRAYPLDPRVRVASQTFHFWGKHHLDLFATRVNRILLLFVSPVLDPEAYATDAPSLSWRGMWAYAFPPFPSDSSLSQENSGRMFSVPHCSSLGGASIVPSISVTSGNSSFEEGSAVSAFFHNIVSPPKVFHLQAWLLCNNTCKQQAFMRIYSAKRPSTNNLYD